MPTKTVEPRPPGPVKLFHPPTRPACGGNRVWLPPDPEGWVVEPKYNGHRCILDCDNQVLYNRQLELYSYYTHKIPLTTDLARQARNKYVKYLDLEGMGSHRSTSHRNMAILFDVYGVDSTTQERRQVLLTLGYPVHDPFTEAPLRSMSMGSDWNDWNYSSYIYVVPQYPATCAEELFHTLMLMPGDVYEGVVLKQLDNSYRNNRWVKFRFDQYKQSGRPLPRTPGLPE